MPNERAADPVGNGGTRHEAKPDTLVEAEGRIVVSDIQAEADGPPCGFG